MIRAARITGSLLGAAVAIAVLPPAALAHRMGMALATPYPMASRAHRSPRAASPAPRAPHTPRHSSPAQVRATAGGRSGLRGEPRSGWGMPREALSGERGTGIRLVQHPATRRVKFGLRRSRSRAPPNDDLEPTALLEPLASLRHTRRFVAERRYPPTRHRSTHPITDPVSGAGRSYAPARYGAAVPALPRPPREGRGGVTEATPFHGGSP